MKKLIFFTLLGALLLPAIVIAGSDNVFQGKWLSSTALQVAPLPEGREGYCLGISGNEIYMTHGYTNLGDTGDVRAYDIDGDTWITLTSSPNVRAEGIGASHGGLIYCMGGRHLTVLNLVEVYDPTTDSWATLSSMNVARAGLAAAVVGNKIYAIGGRAATGGPCSGPPLNVAEVYDISTDTWSNIAPPPIPVTDPEAVAHGGKIYLLGGCDEDLSDTNHLQIYDPQKDRWTLGPAMPTSRASLAASVLGNTIYAIGGIDIGTGNLDTVEAYDIDKKVWSGPLTHKTTSASEIHGAVHGGKIYVPGGGSYGLRLSVFEVFKKK